MIDYWIEVHDLLVQNYNFEFIQASDVIKAFRFALQKDGAEDIIYHDDPENVAKTLSTATPDSFTDPVYPDDLC